MRIAYASRTGNVQSIVDRLEMKALYIENGTEKIDEPYILLTYTDGFGDVPYEVEVFLSALGNAKNLRGVIVSGDVSYGKAYCLAGDKIAEDFKVPCLYKVENEGKESDIEAIRKTILEAK